MTSMCLSKPACLFASHCNAQQERCLCWRRPPPQHDDAVAWVSRRSRTTRSRLSTRQSRCWPPYCITGAGHLRGGHAMYSLHNKPRQRAHKHAQLIEAAQARGPYLVIVLLCHRWGVRWTAGVAWELLTLDIDSVSYQWCSINTCMWNIESPRNMLQSFLHSWFGSRWTWSGIVWSCWHSAAAIMSPCIELTLRNAFNTPKRSLAVCHINLSSSCVWKQCTRESVESLCMH